MQDSRNRQKIDTKQAREREGEMETESVKQQKGWREAEGKGG